MKSFLSNLVSEFFYPEKNPAFEQFNKRIKEQFGEMPKIIPSGYEKYLKKKSVKTLLKPC